MFIVLIYHPALTPLVFSAHQIRNASVEDMIVSLFWTFLGCGAPYDNMNPEVFEA